MMSLVPIAFQINYDNCCLLEDNTGMAFRLYVIQQRIFLLSMLIIIRHVHKRKFLIALRRSNLIFETSRKGSEKEGPS